MAIVPLVDAESDRIIVATCVLVVALQQVDVHFQVFFHSHRSEQGSLGTLKLAVVNLRCDVIVQRQIVELFAGACKHFSVPCGGASNADQAQASHTQCSNY